MLVLMTLPHSSLSSIDISWGTYAVDNIVCINGEQYSYLSFAGLHIAGPHIHIRHPVLQKAWLAYACADGY